jgi:hypothetical protein
MKDVQYVSATELHAGDVAYFHGAQFEIVSTGESRGHIDGVAAYNNSFNDFVGPSPVATPRGRWIGGEVVEGYFGPDRDWYFQGNRRRVVAIQPRTH